MAGKNAQRRDQQEAGQEARIEQLEAQQPQAPAAVPAAPGGSDVVARLTELKGLMDSGVLDADEFEAAKRKLLAG